MYLPSMAQHSSFAARVPAEYRCGVIDVVVNYQPAVALIVVLLDLLPGELLLWCTGLLLCTLYAISVN